MLSEKALYYYNNNYNCSQCILKAYCEHYNISSIPLNAFSAINNGFGIGSVCSVLISGIIALSIKFDSTTAKRKRMLLLNKFHNIYSDINCSKIKKYGCENIIKDVCNILEELSDDN